MAKRATVVALLGVLFTLTAGLIGTATADVRAGKRQVRDAAPRLPLAFERNDGQTDRVAKFIARGPDFTLLVTPVEARLALRTREGGATLWMTFLGANRNATVVGLDQLPGRSHYLIGNDSRQWRTNVPTYARVKVGTLYRGVDLVYYGNEGQVEYDLVLAPGANPKTITLGFRGAQSLTIDSDGDLVARTRDGSVRLRKPVVYQETADARRTIEGCYELRGHNRVGIHVGPYDQRQPLVIDPVLSYATYLGGSGSDSGTRIGRDWSGNIYVVGSTRSIDFPTTPGAFLTSNPSPTQDNIFVSKLNSNGSSLLYSTYLGGTNLSAVFDAKVDGAGHVYLTGLSLGGFPTTVNGFQPFPDSNPSLQGQSTFVTKLSSTGAALLYSSYLHGTVEGRGIAVDNGGHAWITGIAWVRGIADPPGALLATTPGAFRISPTAAKEGYVAKFDTNASGAASLVYATYLPGAQTPSGIAVDAPGNAYVAGSRQNFFPGFVVTTSAFQPIPGDTFFNDLWLAKLNAAGSALLYATFLGGSSYESFGRVAVDDSGHAWIAGSTISSDLPSTPDAFQSTFQSQSTAFSDGLVAKFNTLAAGPASLEYLTYFGGSLDESFHDIALDASGAVYLTGTTSSTDFPVLNAPQPSHIGIEGFAVKLSASGLVYSIFLGGTGFEGASGITVDVTGNAYIVGGTNSLDFPPVLGGIQTVNAGGSDAFLVKLTATDFATAPDGGGVAVSTAPHTSGEAGVAAMLTNNTTGSGAATVTAENLGATSPVGTSNIFDVGGNYVDLKVTGADLTDVVDARFYYPLTIVGETEAALSLFFYNGVQWLPVLTSGGNPPTKDSIDNLDGTISGGRFSVIFDATSTPKVTELTGTMFTSALPLDVNDPPVANAGSDQTVSAGADCQAQVMLDGTGSSDPDGDALTYTWIGSFGTANGATPTVTLPLGVHAITLTVTDSQGSSASDTVVITVADTSAPAITALTADPAFLWPPKHQMVRVSLTAIATDNCGGAVTCEIVSVTSDELVQGLGDGDTAPDWEITGQLTLRLRAERDATADGRVYTITVRCTDDAGNVSTKTVTVFVPRML